MTGKEGENANLAGRKEISVEAAEEWPDRFGNARVERGKKMPHLLPMPSCMQIKPRTA